MTNIQHYSINSIIRHDSFGGSDYIQINVTTDDCRDYDPYFMTDNVIKEIQAEAEKNGYKISKDAILHNFDRWVMGYKSGYRDEANNYHVFTPSGDNHLSYAIAELKDYLETY